MRTDPAADRVQRAQLNLLLAGADPSFNYYQLPEAIHKALLAEQHVLDQLAEARAESGRRRAVGEITGQLASEVVIAAREGKVLAGLGDKVAEAEQAARRAAFAVEVLEVAASEAGYEVLASLAGDEIIVKSLRPAFADLLADVAKIATKLDGWQDQVGHAEAFLKAPARVLDAYNRLLTAAERFGAIRTAHAAALHFAPPQYDKAAWFAGYRRPDELGIDPAGRFDRQPYPEHVPQRLLWIVQNAMKNAWCPTGAEMDQAYQEWHDRQRAKNPHFGAAVGL